MDCATYVLKTKALISCAVDLRLCFHIYRMLVFSKHFCVSVRLVNRHTYISFHLFLFEFSLSFEHQLKTQMQHKCVYFSFLMEIYDST